MSAGTSGILPSATYAACDGANSVVGKDPLWLSTAGGNIVGNLGITGNELVSGTLGVAGALSAASLSGAFANMGAMVGGLSAQGINAICSMVIGKTRFCWGYTTQFNTQTHTVTLQFNGIPAGTLPGQTGAGVYNKVGSDGIQFAIAISVNGLSTGGIVGVFPNQTAPSANQLGAVTFQEENANAVGAIFFVVGEYEGTV
jgi:hypothetical protein